MSTGDYWSTALVGQLTSYWEYHRWPRLQGLGDDEYFWAPAPGGWTVREVTPGRWGAWFEDPMVGLVLHVNREVRPHGGEIGLLRDLYPHRGP